MFLAVLGRLVSLAKAAELIEGQNHVCPRNYVLYRGAHWQYLADTVERFMHGGSADYCNYSLL